MPWETVHYQVDNQPGTFEFEIPLGRVTDDSLDADGPILFIREVDDVVQLCAKIHNDIQVIADDQPDP